MGDDTSAVDKLAALVAKWEGEIAPNCGFCLKCLRIKGHIEDIQPILAELQRAQRLTVEQVRELAMQICVEAENWTHLPIEPVMGILSGLLAPRVSNSKRYNRDRDGWNRDWETDNIPDELDVLSAPTPDEPKEGK